jgi:Zn-dependent M28 family amino/carboxypeptidase
MKPFFRFGARWNHLPVALLSLTLLSPNAFALQSAAAPKPAAAALTSTERRVSTLVKKATISTVTTTLASKEMQGRGTAQPGGDKAARYIADAMARLGLKPLGETGTYLQTIKFKSDHILADTSVKAGDATLKFKDDFVLAPPFPSEPKDVTAGVVFVGYGLTSTELKREDLAGIDVKNKLVIILGGKPKNVDEATWSKLGSSQVRFGGLLARGVAGVMITNFEVQGQNYSTVSKYLSRRQVSLADAPVMPIKLPPIMLVSDGGAEKLFAGSGISFAQAKEKAESGEMVSRDLNRQATLAIRVKREEGTSSNVVGLLEGADAALKEQAVVYSAHYDAYGMDADGTIYPGAADDALGVGAVMAIAEAFTKSPARPRRSIIFLMVTGEEHGLLGSEHWVKHPTWPIEKVAANINYDGIGTEVWGPIKNVIGYGKEYSDLGAMLEGVVAGMGNTVAADPFPEEKAFYRSDHYAFVKKGIPALMLLGAPDGDMEQFKARAKKWLDTDYHMPTDTVRADWNWEGMRAMAVTGMILGLRVANQDAMPAWLPTSPFNQPRGTNKPPPPAK